MSSNYNYNNFALAHLNSLNPVPPPEMSSEDIARELEFLASNSHFIEVPPGMSLLDDDFPEQTVTQPTMLVGTLPNQTQTQQPLQYYFQPIALAPVTTTSNDNFAPIFPAAPIASVSVPTNVVNNNPVILSKETQENASSTTPPATEITTDPIPTVESKTTTTVNTTNRKNSSTKSNQSSNSETTQNGSEKKEDEKDPELTQKLAAEEDKRRRNTAASARFRVKKKMREQALERTAREMTAKAEMFEGRVRELEMEIKWLRSLIVEKDARLLDIERPGKRRKKDERKDERKDESEEDDNYDEKEKDVKQEQSDRASQKE